jgi:UDP-glucose 4-epimerase
VRVLVTGGTGFVGSNLVRRLARDGHDVHLLVRPEARRWRLLDIVRDVKWHTADLTDGVAVCGLMAAVRPAVIYHLAVYGAYSFESDIAATVRTNILGTQCLLQAALATGFSAMVNTGSSSEYGFKDHAPVEEEVLAPNSHYAVTKASSTWLCRLAAKTHHAHIATLRLYSAYGPYEDGRRLMPSLVRCGLGGSWPPLADPESARDYVYVDDVVDAYLLAATASGQELGAVYNVATGTQTSLRQLTEVAARVFTVSESPTWGTYAARSWDTSVWRGDTRNIREKLRWSPRIDVASGLHRFAQWMSAHAHLYERMKVA